MADLAFFSNALWEVLGWSVIWHLFLGCGITIGYHRYLTHRGFKTPRWIEYILVTFGYLAFQGPPTHWVAIHRIHHAYSDTALDPHSPVEKGWLYGQIAWIWDRRYDPETLYQTFPVLDVAQNTAGKVPEYCKRWCPELIEDPYYRFLDHGHIFVILQLVSLAIAWAIGGPTCLIGRLIATFTSFSVTGWVNSFCHLPCFGANAPFKNRTKDQSKNVWWVALVTMGEGWHNNHHAFQKSAAHGLHWWQVDGSWYAIRVLQLLGLASAVYRPSKQHLLRALEEGASSQNADEKVLLPV